MTTVLVLGGGGYIGSVATEMLLDQGYCVNVMDRLFFGRDVLASLEKRPGLRIVKEDTRYAEPEIFDGVDVVMDLAGISNDPASDLAPSITEEINHDGAVHMARMAKAAGVSRYIYSSSCSIYGHNGNSGDRLTECSEKAPVSLYARTKIAAEAALSSMNDEGFSVTFLRNATVYGLSHRMRFDLVINLMTLYAYKHRRLYVMGGGQQWRPLIHVRDVARAFIAVMEAPPEQVSGQAFNVGSNDQNYQIHRIAQMVRDVVPHTSLEVVPDDPDKRSYNVSFDKIEKVLGFRCEKSPYEGIVEVKQALEQGRVEETIRTKTVHYYQYLLEAQRVLAEVSYNGKVF